MSGASDGTDVFSPVILSPTRHPTSSVPLLPSNNTSVPHSDLSELESLFLTPHPPSESTPQILSSYTLVDEDSNSQFNIPLNTQLFNTELLSLQSPIKYDVSPSSDLLLQFDDLLVPKPTSSQTSSPNKVVYTLETLNLPHNDDKSDSAASGESFGTPPNTPSWEATGYPQATQEQYPPATQEQYPPATQEQFHPATQEQFHPATQEQSPPATQEQSPPATQEQSPPATQEQFHPATQEQSPPATQEQSPPATQEQSPPATQEQSPPATQEQFHPATQEQSPPQLETKPDNATHLLQDAMTESVSQNDVTQLQPITTQTTDNTPAQHSNLPVSAPTSRGSVLLLHGMSPVISEANLKLHFRQYKACIIHLEVREDPDKPDLKLGVVKFSSPQLATQLQVELSQLPLCGEIHKVTVDTCDLLVDPSPSYPSHAFRDNMDDLDNCSVMEGAPMTSGSGRRARSLSPASREFSPVGSRRIPNRVPRDNDSRYPSKFQRVESPSESTHKINTVIVRNIPSIQAVDAIKRFVDKWWSNQIQSAISSKDQKTDNNSILYINTYSYELPELILAKLLENGFIVHPMDTYLRMDNNWTGHLSHPVTRKRRSEMTQDDFRGSYDNRQQEVDYPQYDNDYPSPPQENFSPPREEHTVVILHKVIGEIDDSDMKDYFCDYLNYAVDWYAKRIENDIKKDQMVNKVRVVFSSREAAVHAVESLQHVPLNGAYVMISLEEDYLQKQQQQQQQPCSSPRRDRSTPDDAYLIVSGFDKFITEEYFEAHSNILRYKEHYSELRVQTNNRTGEKRVQIKFHDRDAIIEAEGAMLQANFRDKQMDAVIEKIAQATPPSPVRPTDCMIIVSNLPPSVTVSEVGSVFGVFGRIIKDIEVRPMGQNPSLRQCKVVFDNPDSATQAIKAKDSITYKGHILEVKPLSQLIQMEPETTPQAPTPTQATSCLSVQPNLPRERVENRKMSNELLEYFKNRYTSHIQRFVQSEGSRCYNDGCLTVKHSNPDILADFVTHLDQVSESIENLKDSDLKFLCSSDQPNCPTTNLEKILGSLRETKHIDYRTTYFPSAIHIFGDKNSVVVAMKDVLVFLNSKLDLHCPLDIFFRCFPTLLYIDATVFEISGLKVRIHGASLNNCKQIRETMERAIQHCCTMDVSMPQKFLKSAHIYITRNDIPVSLLIKTPDGKFLDRASKPIEGAAVCVCGFKANVDSLLTVLENPCEKIMTISQNGLRKLTRKHDGSAKLLDKYEAKSKVCIRLENKNSLVITGFIQADVDAMVEELESKLQDERLTLTEVFLEKLQKFYLVKGVINDPQVVSEIIQELEVKFQLKVEITDDNIINLSGDQESILSVENNQQELKSFLSSKIPIMKFHKVVVASCSERFAHLIFKYVTYLSGKEYFIFEVLKPRPMSNRPGSHDIQVVASAHPTVMARIEPKIKEIRASSELINSSKEDFKLYQSAEKKFTNIQDTEFVEFRPDPNSCTLEVLSVGVSSRPARALFYSGLSDEEDRREVSITAPLAFYIREKNLVKELEQKFSCIVKLEEDRTMTCRVTMCGKRDVVAKIVEYINSLSSLLVCKSVQIVFPSRKYFQQFQKEVILVKDLLQQNCKVVFDMRSILVQGNPAKECSVNLMSEARTDVDKAVTQFTDSITFDKITKPLTQLQHSKMVTDILTELSKHACDNHYYIDLTFERFSIMALRCFAKEAIPCGEKYLQPYYEFTLSHYPVPNLPIFHSLCTPTGAQKINAIGINNSVKIHPPPSCLEPYKIEGPGPNVNIAVTQIIDYVNELSKCFTTCKIPVNCPIAALEADQDINGFIESMSHPDNSVAVTLGLSHSTATTTGQTLIASYEFPLNTHSLTLEILKGDITKLNIDAIVNAANERLSHGGGVAAAISNAGGPSIQESSNKFIETNGLIPVSGNVILPAGRIMCGSIIHAVGPVWDENNATKVNNELGNCVYNILASAEKAGFQTIALPTISAGIFAFPLQLSTSIILEAIQRYFTSRMLSAFKKIILIDIQDNILQQLKKNCDNNTCFKPQGQQKPQNIISASIAPPIKKLSSPPVSAFQFQDDHKTWVSYSDPDNLKLMQAYASNPQGASQISRSKYTYTVDFATMVQTNDQTKAQRRIQLTNSAPQADNSLDLAAKPEPFQPPPSWREITSEIVTFYGRKDRLDELRDRFEGLVKPLMKKKTFDVRRSNRNDLITIMTSRKTPFIRLALDEKQDSLIVTIEGYYRDVNTTETEIMAELMKIIQSQSPNCMPPPHHWTPQANNELCKLVVLQPPDPEYNEVVNKLRSTLPAASIIRVERIQNTWLWTRYQQDKQRIIQKTGGEANEMIVYHGTSSHSPALIYKGEQGFESRLASSGMWGKASYFAVNAFYSNNYAFQCQNGNRQLFSVKICAGDVIEMASDKTLRLPPLKTDINAPQPMSVNQLLSMKPTAPKNLFQNPFNVSLGTMSTGVVVEDPDICNPMIQPQTSLPTIPIPIPAQPISSQFVNDRYDTVSGTTGGSKVYMIYENGRAYPEYLITYR